MAQATQIEATVREAVRKAGFFFVVAVLEEGKTLGIGWLKTHWPLQWRSWNLYRRGVLVLKIATSEGSRFFGEY